MGGKQNGFHVYNTSQGAIFSANEAGADTIKNQFLDTPGTAENLAVPAGTSLVRICCNADVWYEYDATAAIPTADEASAGAIYLPVGLERFLIFGPDTVTNISFVSSTSNAIVNALFWD